MNTRDRITEYKLIVEDNAQTFTEQINFHLRRGWQPWGGPGFAGPLYQAMVFRAQPEDEAEALPRKKHKRLNLPQKLIDD